MPALPLLSDTDVGFGTGSSAPGNATPKLLSDEDVGLTPQATGNAPSPENGFSLPNAQPAAQPPSTFGPAVDRLLVPRQTAAPAPATQEPAPLAPDESGFDNSPGAPSPPNLSGIAARMGSALISGWKDSPEILTPQAQAWLANAERNNPRPNLQDVLTVGNGALAAGNAVFRGGLEGIAAFGEAAGAPQLGRDVAGYYEAMGMTSAPHVPALLRATMPETRAALTEQRLAGGQQTSAPDPAISGVAGATNVDDAISNAASWAAKPAPSIGLGGTLEEQTFRLDAEARAEGYASAEDKLAQGGYAAGAVHPAQQEAAEPQSAGAAASRDMTNPGVAVLSTADMKANRYQAEMGELLAPPAAGDTRVIVPGSLPTLAEYSGDPLISQQENLVRQRNPGAFIGDGKRLTENNTARVTLFDDNTPSRTALDMMRDDRDAQWAADADGILPDAQPADLTPAWDWVQGKLSDPRIQENDAVRGVLEDFRDRLVDEDGNLKTDPAAIWGIHDNLQNQLAKAKDPLNATGAEKYAQSEIIAAKQVTDDVMNTATGNQFQTALDNYAKASQAINAGELLDAFRPKLTNSSGAIMGDRFHNFVVGLARLRGNHGIDPAMSISDGTMRSMIDIDTDLKRAGLIKLGAAAGSPTNLLGALAETMGLGAAHLVAGSVAPGIGNLALNVVGKAIAGPLGKYRLDRLTEKHLAPPPGGYRYPEPEPPPAAPAVVAPAPTGAAPGPLFARRADEVAPPALLNGTPPNSLARRTGTGYKPPVVAPRPFEADYSGGAQTDGSGNLTHTIEGQPITAQYVVGRKASGEPDVALSPAGVVGVSERLLGATPTPVAGKSIAGDGGRLSPASDPVTGDPAFQLVYNRSLPPGAREDVIAHEVAHGIDYLARTIDQDGIKGELGTVYHALNAPDAGSSAPRSTPQNLHGYTDKQAPMELMAEAIRAYMQDPNYLKTVAPGVAARIREAVNANPTLRDMIQFNGVAALIVGATAAVSARGQRPDDAAQSQRGLLNGTATTDRRYH